MSLARLGLAIAGVAALSCFAVGCSSTRRQRRRPHQGPAYVSAAGEVTDRVDDIIKAAGHAQIAKAVNGVLDPALG